MSESFRKRRVTFADDMGMKPTYWAWAENGFGRIPLGELTLVAGHGESGKSILNIGLIALLTTGDLPGYFFGYPRFVLIAASEDDWEKTILPRLVVAGADLSMVARFDIVTQTAKDGVKVSLPQDYDELEAAVVETRAAWVFFESVVSAIDLVKDINHGQHVRDVMERLADIARRQECVVIGSVHFNKNIAAHAMERMSGSNEFRNVARAVIYMAMQEDGTGVISKSKNNLGRGWPSLSYEIREMVASRNPYITAGFLEILGETESDASDVIANTSKRKRKLSSEVQAIIEVLREMFSNREEWLAEECMSELRKAGASTNKSVVQKAKDELNITSVPVRTKGKAGVDYWIWTSSLRKFRVLLAKILARRRARARPPNFLTYLYTVNV
jgi:archaellum biogenesis ATPase FlaH